MLCRHSWYQAWFPLPLVQSSVSISEQLTAHSCTLQTIVLGWTTFSRHGDPLEVCHSPHSEACPTSAWYGHIKAQPLSFKAGQLYHMLCSRALLWDHAIDFTTSLLISLPFLVLLPHFLTRVLPPYSTYTWILVSGSASRASVHLQSQVRKLWPTVQPPVCANKVLVENTYTCPFTHCLWLLLHYISKPK